MLDTSDAIYTTVAAIANKVISEGPIVDTYAADSHDHAERSQRSNGIGPRTLHGALDRYDNGDVDRGEHVL